MDAYFFVIAELSCLKNTIFKKSPIFCYYYFLLLSEVADLRSPGSPKPLVPDLLSHRVARSIPEINTSSAIMSKPPLSSRGWVKRTLESYFQYWKTLNMTLKYKPGKPWKNSPCSLKIHLRCCYVFCHQGEVWCGPNCRRCWLPWRTPSALRGPGLLQSQHLTGKSTNNSWRQLRRAGPRLHRY